MSRNSSSVSGGKESLIYSWLEDTVISRGFINICILSCPENHCLFFRKRTRPRPQQAGGVRLRTMTMPLCRRCRHRRQELKALVVKVVRVAKMKAVFPGTWLQDTTTSGHYLDRPVNPPWGDPSRPNLPGRAVGRHYYIERSSGFPSVHSFAPSYSTNGSLSRKPWRSS